MHKLLASTLAALTLTMIGITHSGSQLAVDPSPDPAMAGPPALSAAPAGKRSARSKALITSSARSGGRRLSGRFEVTRYHHTPSEEHTMNTFVASPNLALTIARQTVDERVAQAE